MNSAVATLVSVIASVAAILTAIGGVLLVIRTIRSRERIALTRERNQVEKMLERERKERVAAELEKYRLEVLLAEHGITAPDQTALVRAEDEIGPGFVKEQPETKALEPPKDKPDGSD